MSMKQVWWLAWLAMLAGAGPAHAHSPVPGIEGFYIGLLHPFSTPSQALLMIGIGLLVGGFDVERARWHLGAFLAVTFIGILAGGGFEDLDATMFAAAFSACALAALVPGKLLPITIVLVMFAGFQIGAASIPDPGPTRDRVITMTGSLVGANVGLLYMFGIIVFVRERYPWRWVEIALRVMAAWLGAISLLMLALRFARVDPSL